MSISAPHPAPGHPGHHLLRRLRVDGGFLSGLDLPLCDGLNCLIGGRGSGKTTVLEFIRFALGREPAASGRRGNQTPEDRIRQLIEHNLTRDGQVELEVESRDGATYTIRRKLGEAPTLRNHRGEQLDSNLLHSHVFFDVALFSHNQIEAICNDPKAQRELLDRLCDHKLKNLTEELAAARTALVDNAQKQVNLQQKLAAADRELIELASWERRLEAADAALARGGLSPKLKAATQHRSQREREQKGLARQSDALGALEKLLGDTAPAHLQDLGRALPEAKGPNAEALASLQQSVDRLRTEIEILLSPAVERLAQLRGTHTQLRQQLEQAHRQQQQEYEALTTEAQAHQARLQARDEAAAQVSRLTQAKQAIQTHRDEAAAAQKLRLQLSQQFHELRRQRFAARNTQAERISQKLGGRVRVRFEKDGAREQFREFLVGLMRRSGRQYNAPIDRLIATVTPSQLAIFCDSDDHEALAGMADVTPDFAQALVEQVREKLARRLSLDSLDLEEVPQIELRLGQVWRPTQQLSTGQKSAALLPILLLESEAPLLIDQPEDNLDNRYISDAIVPQMREVKTDRQLLCITHNPNLPVLGDAENVCVLAADGQRSELVGRGTVPDVRDHILRLMEGGLEAFRRRQQEYERTPTAG